MSGPPSEADFGAGPGRRDDDAESHNTFGRFDVALIRLVWPLELEKRTYSRNCSSVWRLHSHFSMLSTVGRVARRVI